MADFDTSVLHLVSPPLEAPPASYIIGVLMKNLGIQPASTSGYVQVFRKSTGELVRTFNVASAEMDPDEEKQAFASVALDLTEEEPGEQFIFSGNITSPADTNPSNDNLNPTTITIIDAPPPPPPPVAAHANQHEDGGSDELRVDGLHGVLATPQPYADHATGHEAGGSDPINVEGMPGVLVTPQIAADHGNERHVVPFLFASELTNHMNDATPHDADVTVERKMNKDQAEGYAGLDVGALVPPAILGTGLVSGAKFLRDDQSWQVPPGTVPPRVDIGRAIPRWNPNVGTSEDIARADHQHQQGGLYSAGGGGGILGPGAHPLANLQVDTGAEGVANEWFELVWRLFGRVDATAPLTLTFAAQFGHPVSGWFPFVIPALTFGPGLVQIPLEIECRAMGYRNILGVIGLHTWMSKCNFGTAPVGDSWIAAEMKAVTPQQPFDPLADAFVDITVNIGGGAPDGLWMDASIGKIDSTED